MKLYVLLLGPIFCTIFYNTALYFFYVYSSNTVSCQIALLSIRDEISALNFTCTISHFIFYKCYKLSEPLAAVTMTFTFLGNISGSQNAILAYLPVSPSMKRSTLSINITILWQIYCAQKTMSCFSTYALQTSSQQAKNFLMFSYNRSTFCFNLRDYLSLMMMRQREQKQFLLLLPLEAKCMIESILSFLYWFWFMVFCQFTKIVFIPHPGSVLNTNGLFGCESSSIQLNILLIYFSWPGQILFCS